MQNLYMGYAPAQTAPGKEKQPLNAAVLKTPLQLEQLYNEPNILAILRPDVVMVDFDTAEDAQAFQKILDTCHMTVPSMQTTKGRHYYFAARPEVCDRSYTHAQLACGVLADFKLGARNGLDLIKYQGQFRQWSNQNEPLKPLPRFCTPTITNNKSFSFAAIGEGTRNSELFKHVGRLKRAGFTQEEANSLLNIVNRCVLPVPVEDREINTIARPEAFNNAMNELPGTGRAPKIDYLLEAESILAKEKIITRNGVPFIREQGYKYVMLNDLAFARLVLEYCPEATSMNSRKEIMNAVMVLAPEAEDKADIKNPHLMAFSNGIVNLNTGSILPEGEDTGKTYFFAQVPHDFPTAPPSCPLAEKFLFEVACGDADTVRLLLETIGACLYRKAVLRGVFILVGDTVNGKSTFLKWLNFILGPDNVSNLKLHDLNKQFMTINLLGKLANLGDDIGDGYIKDSDIIKNVATSDTIVADIKHRTPIVFSPYATQVFTSNFLPRISDPTGAVQNRLVIVPFNAKFTTPNLNMLEELCTEDAAQWALYWGALYFSEAVKRKSYTLPAASREAAKEYAESNNPILMFIREQYDEPEELDGKSVKEVYDLFVEFCRSETISPFGRLTFTRRLVVMVENIKKSRRRNSIGELEYYLVKIDPTQPLKFRGY